MDVICPRCGEPWDFDCLHEEAQARTEEGRPTKYSVVAAQFRSEGCKALQCAYGPMRDCVVVDDERTLAAGALYELLGDDMDGAAAMLEDLGLS